MPCRIGMTTNPDARKKDWKARHPTLRNWKILGEYDSKTKAQKAETEFAEQYGCKAYSGGSGPQKGDWVVYKFNY